MDYTMYCEQKVYYHYELEEWKDNPVLQKYLKEYQPENRIAPYGKTYDHTYHIHLRLLLDKDEFSRLNQRLTTSFLSIPCFDIIEETITCTKGITDIYLHIMPY